MRWGALGLILADAATTLEVPPLSIGALATMGADTLAPPLTVDEGGLTRASEGWALTSTGLGVEVVW